ncbi:hypothetical protein HMPREF9440_00227 [Sutterella parvirubra YIT 11816]|uniref:Uncharacterized protein n=1 Tax=Sutterella parvirubra YIT 11816 TaxID=762967 RepID=H3KBY0_9BURK|nr:hypothetical protein HMPREF9440_00227 [Sutterella parvirubra YIT 11816]
MKIAGVSGGMRPRDTPSERRPSRLRESSAGVLMPPCGGAARHETSGGLFC